MDRMSLSLSLSLFAAVFAAQYGIGIRVEWRLWDLEQSHWAELKR